MAGADDARRFFGGGMAALRNERLCVAHLDADRRLLGLSLGYSRYAGHVEVPFRRIAADCLALGTHGIVVAHNHPSGDPTPSREDRVVTGRLSLLADALDIILYDHLIFARAEHRSFRALGLL